MKIVNLKELIKLPVGTVYRDINGDGWYGPMEVKMSDTFGAISLDPSEDEGYEIGIAWDSDLICDYHDEDEFLVYEESDIDKLIDILQKAKRADDSIKW